MAEAELLGAHFLQSEAWGQFQGSLGRTVVRGQGDGWSVLAILEKGRINSRLYAPYGPTVVDEVALEKALLFLTAEARRLGATFVRIEPIGGIDTESLMARRLVKVNHVQPSLTWRLDLTPGIDAVVAGTAKSVRSRYRNFEKKGLSFRRSSDPGEIGYLTDLMAGVAERNKIRPHPPSYFEAQARQLLPSGAASLYFVEYEGAVVAASLSYDDDVRRYYAHAAAADSARSLAPGVFLVMGMIADAVSSGLREFDFYGIAPADQPDHPWAGFSEFKRSFGGYDVPFVGTWELPVKPAGYAVYRLLRRVLD